MIRVVLVDEDKLVRKRLRVLLERYPGLGVVGESGGLPEAVRMCDRLRPEVVFLDVLLPPGDGFELLGALKPDISAVFHTASEAHAIRALDEGAVDYLLKPVSKERLALTIRRLKVMHADAGAEVLLGESHHWRQVPFSSIGAILSEGDYTRVMLIQGGRNSIIRRKMTDWATILPEGFLRLSRTLWVNRHAISEFKAESRDLGEIWLKGNPEPIVLGRVSIRELRRHF